MAIQNITTTSWTEVTTTTGNTIFQNAGGNTFAITTESTSGLEAYDGLMLGPGDAVVVTAGKTVSVSSHSGRATVFYMEV